MKQLPVLLYNLAIRLYGLGLRAAVPLNEKARKWVSGRKKLWESLEQTIPSSGVDVWIHCASLGEFEQGRPLIEAFRKKNPSLFILLTFFSPSGYEVRKNYAGADWVCYLPLDTKKNARHFISIIQPRLTLFVKYEFWYHFIDQLQKQERPVLLVSGIFRENQVFFKKYGRIFKQLLSGYTHLFLQDKRSAELLSREGFTNYSLAGDTRFDRVKQLSLTAKTYPEIAHFIDGKNCWIVGSSWPRDEQLIRMCMDPVPKWIIAPHEIGEPRLKEIERLFGSESVRYSTLIKDPAAAVSARVLILDNIGMLSAVYRLGKVAYIGGGFGHGIHNILEAAVNRVPVIFGPRYHKFEEAKALIANGGAFAIQNQNELKETMENLLRPSFRKEAGEKAGQYIEDNLGATKKIMDYIQENRFLIKA